VFVEDENEEDKFAELEGDKDTGTCVLLLVLLWRMFAELLVGLSPIGIDVTRFVRVD
jgi:hypothetical protein